MSGEIHAAVGGAGGSTPHGGVFAVRRSHAHLHAGDPAEADRCGPDSLGDLDADPNDFAQRQSDCLRVLPATTRRRNGRASRNP
ncbi:MAG: hypothetical protein ABIS84_14700 [Arachnia sp.]